MTVAGGCGGCGKRAKPAAEGKRLRSRDCPICGLPFRLVPDPVTGISRAHCATCGYHRGV